MDDVARFGSNRGRTAVLLLSGGIDSAAIAQWVKPDLALFIDYGQRPASAERRSAFAIAAQLGIESVGIEVDASVVGSGILSRSGAMSGGPSEEWWPFRNQLIITLAAAWLLREGSQQSEILIGSVRPDRERHRDGSPDFYRLLNDLLMFQEGEISVRAPAIEYSTEELVAASGLDDSTLGWTHSCHAASIPCMSCPGCYKREQVLEGLGRLQ